MQYTFGVYQLDLQQYELSRAGERRPLRPKAFQVLVYLLAHRERVVSKAELLEHVWPKEYVGDAALSSCLKTIRRVLDDDGRGQRMIRTVRGQGYRFIASVVVDRPPVRSAMVPLPVVMPPTPSSSPMPLVGREAELARLQLAFSRAMQGERQLVFVTGEAGIGKTTLVETFLARIAATEALWIGHGQCVEQHGAGEAYLPLLEALGRLSRTPDGHHLVEVLHQTAPSWLVQLPMLLPVDDHERLQRLASGTTPTRMLRELADALELLTVTYPLVLVLEDLQWSDVSTLEWLTYVARRRDPARLLILGTYRPLEAMVHHQPLHAMIRELLRQHTVTEVELPYLSVTDVGAYLIQRFGIMPWSEGLARVIHQRTSGNPFFMISVVEALIQHNALVDQATGWTLREEPRSIIPEVPKTVRHLIEQQLTDIGPGDQALLEVASVVGREFSAAEVAVGVGQTIEAIEARCATLAHHQQFVRPCGLDTWPDGTVTARYSFQHALYQEVLYARVPPSRCRRLHQQIGRRKEAGYGPQARQIAAELAVHFVRGQETWRAVRYLHCAAENALHRSAYQEAVTHLTQGLELLQTLPETPERAHHEVPLQLTLAQTQHVIGGSGSPEVEQAYTRARILCEQFGDTPQLFPVLVGLLVFYNNRGMLKKAQECEAPLLQLAQRLHDPVNWCEAHTVLGLSALWRGDFALALHHFQQGLALSEARPDDGSLFMYGQPADVRCLAFLARTLGYLGYPDQARQQSRTALARAQALLYPPSVVLTLYHATALHQLLRDVPATIEHAEALMTLATQHGFDSWRHAGTVQRDWALVMRGQGEQRLPQMQQSLQRLLDGGAAIFRPGFLILLADAYGKSGQLDTGLELLTAALEEVQENGARYIEADIWRLKGEFVLRQAMPETSTAETYLQQALTVARHQQAKWWELRAAVSLSRLWQQQGKREQARQLLEAIYGWFTEGFATADLQEAQALLATLE
jgi:DNA-binding winged helix-turn-helix (wHTH) protein/predicted ATPase